MTIKNVTNNIKIIVTTKKVIDDSQKLIIGYHKRLTKIEKGEESNHKSKSQGNQIKWLSQEVIIFLF